MENHMKFGIIAGSHRKDSQSERIAHYLATTLKSQNQSHETYIYSLRGNPLPMWDESFLKDDPKWQETWAPVSKELNSSDAIILCAPEWGGLIPAGLRNIFHFCGFGTEFADKPGLIVGISASRGGSYPIAELRSISSKNVRIVYIPDHIIVRNCKNVLLDTPATTDEDQYIRKRVDHTLKVLTLYAQAFKEIRSNSSVDLTAFKFGM
jgi:NAD(P)H-dependent FMN reductase